MLPEGLYERLLDEELEALVKAHPELTASFEALKIHRLFISPGRNDHPLRCHLSFDPGRRAQRQTGRVGSGRRAGRGQPRGARDHQFFAWFILASSAVSG